MAKTGLFLPSGLIAFCFTLAIHIAISQEIPAAAYGKATIHQFGIILRGDLPGLDRPNFVHHASQAPTGSDVLEFSALYFLPPLMMQNSMTFEVKQTLPNVTDWYPYAHETSRTSVRAWDHVLVGVQADGLETSHPAWLPARRMETASTIKVYKPGPPGSKPDDEGTTEGEVFIFLRGQVPDDGIRAILDRATDQWIVSTSPLQSNSTSPLFTSSNRQGWIAAASDSGEILSRIVHFEETSPLLQTTASVSLEPYSRETLDFRMQLNEALTGNGLRPDEASAQSDLIARIVRKSRTPVMVYLLPQSWTDHAIPLEITGPANPPVRLFATIRSLPVN